MLELHTKAKIKAVIKSIFTEDAICRDMERTVEKLLEIKRQHKWHQPGFRIQGKTLFYGYFGNSKVDHKMFEILSEWSKIKTT